MTHIAILNYFNLEVLYFIITNLLFIIQPLNLPLKFNLPHKSLMLIILSFLNHFQLFILDFFTSI